MNPKRSPSPDVPEVNHSSSPGRKPKLVSIEDVMDALASQCDGARSRDGKGFSRSDAQEGGRLAALKRRKWAWTTDDARKALEIAAKYAKQAGDILGHGREAKAQGIERSLRSGFVRCADAVDDERGDYNYAAFSPGGKRVHLWRMAPVDDFEGFGVSLREIAKLRHGVRRVDVEFNVQTEMTINGQKRKAKRSEIDFNGTSAAAILDLCHAHGFVVEPAIEAPVDLEIDKLRLSERAAWLYRGVRDGKKGAWVVFDLAFKHPPFSDAVKRHLVDPATKRRLYSCDPNDDWNWYVVWDEGTQPIVRSMARHFGFSVDAEIAAGGAG